MLRGGYIAALTCLLVACTEPFDTPTAYDGERYLCGAESARDFEREFEACREAWEDDKSCGGVLSFRGQLQGHDVTVDSWLSSALFTNKVQPMQTLRDDYAATGASPYFTFQLQVKGLGGASDLGDVERLLEVGAQDPVDPLADDAVTMSLRLSTGGDSEDLRALRGKLALSIQAQTEAAGSFEGSFGTEADRIEGCFHLFATRITEKKAP